MDRLFIMCPCYNEEEVLLDSAKKLEKVMESLIENKKISEDSRILFVDDGSKDKTWSLIEDLKKENKRFGGIKFSRNFGQSAALMAAYAYAAAEADMCITLDVDLQDDIAIIPDMVDAYLAGNEVVLTVRTSRGKDTFIKKSTAAMYYKFMELMDTQIAPQHPDYRLLSKKTLKALQLFTEKNPYPRGLVPRIGFKTATIPFERKERLAGETKYNMRKMIGLATHSIVTYSNKPLQLPIIPAAVAGISLILPVPKAVNWVFLFLCLYVFGIYIADVKEQVYNRPVYIIDEII